LVAYKAISDYGLIGDMHSAALVGLDGSIDWACMPRFDSPSIFAAILDENKGGHFQIVPSGTYESTQRYLPDTNVLETTFITPTGRVTLTDFMPTSPTRSADHVPHEIHRIVVCVEGTVDLMAIFQPRFDYARVETELEVFPHGVLASNAGETLVLSTDVPMTLGTSAAEGEFTLPKGDSATFIAAYGRATPMAVRAGRSAYRLEHTKEMWERIVTELDWTGMWRDEVVRSFLVLHLLMYAPTGAIVAAPTTSLPEAIGGERNWDYRYCWLRDSAFTLGVLFLVGDLQDARHFLNWLIEMSADHVNSGQFQVLYGITEDSDTKEVTLDHLEGYQGSQPVRIGNGAVDQLQLDVFGEVILSINTYMRYGGYISGQIWSIVNDYAEMTCKSWHLPDRSIWEVRGHERHFTYSKAMCWAALDKAIEIGTATGHKSKLAKWRRVADQIKAEVLTRGWNEEKQAFVQSYDSDVMDASSLILTWTGLLPPDDPRIQSTIARTVEELGSGPFVNRYKVDEADDGLRGEEGALTMLSFWLIGGLMSSGKIEQAKSLFEEMLGYSNHLGLFSEMIDPVTKEALGNFPQAFSHIGLIHTARNLSWALSQRG
jgi:GH15 family glucan-1,4-alpha-glucosidase